MICESENSKLLFYGFILTIPMRVKLEGIGVEGNKIYIKETIQDYTCCGYWMESQNRTRCYNMPTSKDALNIYEILTGGIKK